MDVVQRPENRLVLNPHPKETNAHSNILPTSCHSLGQQSLSVLVLLLSQSPCVAIPVSSHICPLQ